MVKVKKDILSSFVKFGGAKEIGGSAGRNRLILTLGNGVTYVTQS